MSGRATRRSSTRFAKGIPVTQTSASPYSIDENLFGRSIEAGILEDPWNAPPEEPYAFTSDPANAPPPTQIVVGFEQGIPVALDGEELSLAELIGRLNRLAGAYGIGRIDMVENRAVGIKSREVYEAPAALTLVAAHSALEDVVLTKDEARLKRPLEQRWTEIVYEGRWFSPAREAIDAFVDSTQELVTGEVRVELRPNAAVVTGRRSPHTLYASRPRVLWHGRDVPARGGGGLHPDLGPRDRAPRRPGTFRDQGIIRRVATWSGRVESALDPDVWRFLRVDDAELLPYDCEATAQHARRLAAAKFLTEEELEEVESRLAEIAQEPEGYLDSDEDVHSAIERLLGEVGRKIHAGRSRNDQVAAAFRLYVLDACAEVRDAIDAFALVVLSFAESEAETVMPGYTHLQRAQPITLGHHLLAWVEMLDRDRTRFAAAADAASESPLGAGALAGSTLELPAPARQLRNSIDAVADRDFALDYLYAAAVLFTHLSRIGEEIVLWATAEFGFVRLPESAATGSSMMPQKLNPDVAELVRGKAGTAIGRLAGLLATVKGLPLAYDRDLQEDKAPVFSTRKETRLALEALTVLVSGLEVDADALARAAADPLLLATDVAEALVRSGVPFRDAHEQVAASVRDGSFEKPAKAATRESPGPGGIHAALDERAAAFPRRPLSAHEAEAHVEGGRPRACGQVASVATLNSLHSPGTPFSSCTP